METNVLILGFGRMGKEILKECVAQNFNICGVIDPAEDLVGKDAGLVAGVKELGIKINKPKELGRVINDRKPDVAVDFSNPSACLENSEIVAKSGINMVIGTTGFKAKELETLKERILENEIGAVISPNMSIGVNVFWELVEEAVKLLKDRDYDIEIVEAHHRFKKDAPSGTALRTAEIIAKVMGKNLKELAAYGREGFHERKKGEIGIHAIRAGDIVGEHRVLLSTIGERIEITHIAHSRAAFVKGVIAAIKFIKGKKGIYSMRDVIRAGLV